MRDFRGCSLTRGHLRVQSSLKIQMCHSLFPDSVWASSGPVSVTLTHQVHWFVLGRTWMTLTQIYFSHSPPTLVKGVTRWVQQCVCFFKFQSVCLWFLVRCLGWSENFSLTSVEDDVFVWIFCLDHWFVRHARCQRIPPTDFHPPGAKMVMNSKGENHAGKFQLKYNDLLIDVPYLKQKCSTDWIGVAPNFRRKPLLKNKHLPMTCCSSKFYA